MGAVTNAFQQQATNVDFRAVGDAASRSARYLVDRYLPGGRWDGKEYVVRNPMRADQKPGSFKVRDDGVWCDFALGREESGDFIDLVAKLGNKSKLEAARELSDVLQVAPAAASFELTGNVRPIPRRSAAATAASPASFNAPPSTFPPRTAPDTDGKPRFIVAGDDGPRVRDNEKRRHVYRRGGVPVRIKIMLRDRNPFNTYRVTDNNTGNCGWQFRCPEGFEAVPYTTIGANPFGSDGLLFWPEGEKDTETLHHAGLAAFTFGGTGDGLPNGCAEYVRGRDVVILADNDEPGRTHAEQKARAALGIAKSVRVIDFLDTPIKGDVSDWLPTHSVADLLAKVEAAALVRVAASSTSPEPDTSSGIAEERILSRADKKKLPPGYSFSERGLMYQNLDDLDKPAMLIAGHFDVVAETRDGDGASWGVLLRWADHDDREHQLALPRATLAGDGSEARRILMDGGFFIAPSQSARSLFNSFLLQVRSPNRATATQRVGWHGGSFVMPDNCYGSNPHDRLLLQSTTAHEHTFRQTGTLESWQQNVARYAIGNSRLVLAISAAFAGPLIGPCSTEGGGLHFKGASSTGKSTALHVAGSVWGGGDANGYVRSWRATANGLEGVALAHSDTLLCLDELSQLAAKDAGESAYMLANGSGKSRSSRDGSARRAAKWRVLFLSSGEIGLADKVAEDGRGRRLAAGQQVRIVDIAADAGAGMGMFENLHGFTSAEEFARHLQSATHQHYGVAARDYLVRLLPGVRDLGQQVAAMTKAFSAQHVPVGADGQIERVARRFALVAVGGELAQQHGIVPWQSGEAVAAAARCFRDWLSARGGHDAAEVRDGLDQVRSFLLSNGMARFIPAWEADRDNRIQPRDVAGYRQKIGDGWDYYATTTAWKEEICRGLDPRRLAAMMAEKGFIDAPDATRRAKHIRVPGYGQLRLYHILSGFLESGE